MQLLAAMLYAPVKQVPPVFSAPPLPFACPHQLHLPPKASLALVGQSMAISGRMAMDGDTERLA